MPAPPRQVVDDAVSTLRDGGEDAELLMLMLPVGVSHGQRAGVLRGVGDMASAIRARGVPVKVLRVAGQELERRGIAAGADVEALFVLYVGQPPELPLELG
jgi:hypothetical protein